jgi:hypothetical protein
MAVVGTLSIGALYLIGIPGALFLGVFTGLVCFIPVGSGSYSHCRTKFLKRPMLAVASMDYKEKVAFPPTSRW